MPPKKISTQASPSEPGKSSAFTKSTSDKSTGSGKSGESTKSKKKVTVNPGTDLSSKHTKIVPQSESFAVVETYIIIPPDGGWGWVTVAVAFFCNFIADGTMYTFGLFLDDISISINVPKEKVAIANSIMTGSYFLTAPIISALTNRFGYRIIAILGGVTASVAIFITSYANTVITILLVYGIIGGLGFGMMYLPSLIVLGYYFEKWRAIANSIAATGSSLGIICFPLIFKIMLKEEDWRFKFQIISSISMFCGFLSILYRPLEPIRIVNTDEKRVQFIDDYRSLTSVMSAKESKHSVSRFHNTAYPTNMDIHGPVAGGSSGMGPSNISSASVFMGTSGPSTSYSKFSVKQSHSGGQVGKLRTVYEDDEDEEGHCCRDCINCCRNCCRDCCRDCYQCCKRWLCCMCEPKDEQFPERPLYRDDIFYTGSIHLLPEYIKSTHSNTSKLFANESSRVDYHLSVTRMTSAKDMQESYEPCLICPEAVKRTLVTMLDFSLLKSPSFVLLSISGLFSLLGLYTPFMFIAERAIENGIETEIAYSLITTLGIANSVGRMGSGLLSSIPNVNALLISYISLTICGIATLLSSLSFSILYQMGFACIFASTIACVASLRAVIVVEMVGLQNLTNGFGLSLLFQGVACLAGVPLAGVLKTMSGSFSIPFYFSGTVILISGILLMPLKAVMNWENRNDEDDDDDDD